MKNFNYNQEKSIDENQVSFSLLEKNEQQKILDLDQENAKKEDIRRNVQRRDIETATRAMESGGTELEKLYAGFFGSQENCEAFASLVPEEFYSRENLVIIDAGSSKGTLAHYMGEQCKKRGKEVKLIMVDTNSVAMADSPVDAEKITADLLNNPLPEKMADLIILRSVMQYMTPEDQIVLLEILNKNLKPGGILVSQFASYETQTQADAVNAIFSINTKERVNFCGRQEGLELHKSVFGKLDEVAAGPILKESFDDFFIRRIEAPFKRIDAAKKYISENIGVLGSAMTSNEAPYAWQIPYTIVRCVK